LKNVQVFNLHFEIIPKGKTEHGLLHGRKYFIHFIAFENILIRKYRWSETGGEKQSLLHSSTFAASIFKLHCSLDFVSPPHAEKSQAEMKYLMRLKKAFNPSMSA
jgi:hypothetical protein